jgi:hypothetical protein
MSQKSNRGNNSKYKENIPQIAKAICEVYYASDEELADCFDVKDNTFQLWKEKYPELKKSMKNGRCSYHRGAKRRGGYRKGIYNVLARNICSCTGADVELLSEFFGVTDKTIRYWLYKHEEFRVYALNGISDYKEAVNLETRKNRDQSNG